MNHLINLTLFLSLLQPTYGQIGLSQPDEPCGPNEEILRYLEFSLDHSATHNQPHCVAYTLDSKELIFPQAFTGSRFKEESHLTSQGSIDDDYRNSGNDRGHITLASYNKRTDKTLRESYYLSGMSPQNGIHFNRTRDVGYRIEDYGVELAETYDKIYEVAGSVFQDNIGTIGDKGVIISEHSFKVVYFLDY